MLNYIGRKSGQHRETVIEVVDHDKEGDTYYVASGWGTRSDWFQSIRANPEVRIQVGRRKIAADAQVLLLEDSAKRLATYARNHRTAFHELSMLLTGKALAGTDKECLDLARTVPVIAFCPKRS
jgi:deazaflavin-dependent oxidoreductase (nitroreductase family)